ncbi:hypothetical protein COCON_G00212200 [Conger conger]|uniref:B30.2/SPRY domain-containing protein n=1 Tax=Conger conger TaxID=82655 RepID=A0A9Q1CXB2_CONCO|nr:hypothetical protein COCON_G00212200 [Conger conger]
MQLLQDYFPELTFQNHFSPEEIKSFDRKVKVLFIFDGLDECRPPLDFQKNEIWRDVKKPTSVHKLVTNLIMGKLLPSALIWITSRPTAASQIPQKYLHRVTEVRGFNDPQKEEYFRKKIRNQNLVSRIISHLKSSRSLYIMCHIPVFCFISATVLETRLGETKSGDLPKTVTEMYTHFLLVQTSKKNEKYYDSEETNPENMSELDAEIILKLGQLAFLQLDKGNLIFYEEDLRQSGIDVSETSVYSVVCTEIFKVECGLYRKKVYCFVHLSIQEYLAALFVFHACVTENRNVLNVHTECVAIKSKPHSDRVQLSELYRSAVAQALESKNGHLDLFLRFLLGLSLDSVQTLLVGLLTQTGSGSPVQDPQTPTGNRSPVQDPQTPTGSGSPVQDPHTQTGSRSPLQDPQTQTGSRSLVLDPQTPTGHRSPVQDPHTQTGSRSPVLDPQTPTGHRSPVQDPQTPTGSRSSLGRRKTKSIFTFFKRLWTGHRSTVPEPQTEISLTIPDPQTQTESRSESMKKIVQYIKKTIREESSAERTINLFHCLLELNDNYLVEEIQNSLRSGKLSHGKLEPHQCSALAFVLLMREEVLDEFNLKSYNTSAAGHHRLLPVIRSCRKAILDSCDLREKSCDIVASSLQSSNSPLRDLDLSYNNLGDLGVEQLCAGLLSSNGKLQRLGLGWCNLTEGCCDVLASVLRSPHSELKDLELRDNELQDTGVRALSAGLKDPQCKLRRLGLSGCRVTQRGCDFLASALCSNPSHLRELDLRYNHPGDSGVRALCAAKLDTLTLLVDHGGENRTKPGPRKYRCQLTLDPNTAHRELSLPEGNRTVRNTPWTDEELYPDHPERFECWRQVVCRESVCERCYWEAEYSVSKGSGVSIAVTYKGIDRKGGDSDCGFGQNKNSWSLRCSDHNYSVWHNKNETRIPAPPSPYRRSGKCDDDDGRGVCVHRVGVCVDRLAGTLSFYSISDSDTLTLLYKFHTHFTEHMPLCAGFYVFNSSVSLCQLE